MNESLEDQVNRQMEQLHFLTNQRLRDAKMIRDLRLRMSEMEAKMVHLEMANKRLRHLLEIERHHGEMIVKRN